MQWRSVTILDSINHCSPATGLHKVGADETNYGPSTTADQVPPTTASSVDHEQVKIFLSLI